MKLPNRQTLYVTELVLIGLMVIGLGFTIYRIHRLDNRVAQLTKSVNSIPQPADSMSYDEVKQAAGDGVDDSLNSSDLQNQLDIIQAQLQELGAN